MKKLHLLKTMLLLCALIVGSSSVWAEDKTQSWDLTKADYSSANENLITWSSPNISFTSAKNDGTAVNIYLGGTGSNTHTRFYSKNILTFTPLNGASIKKIEITLTASSGGPSYLYDSSTKTNCTASYSSPKVTITPTTGTNACSIQVGGSKKNSRVETVVVTYTGGSDAETATASFTDSPAFISVGDSYTNTIETTPDDLVVTYSSSDNDIATVTTSTGEVTGKGEGIVEITASWTEQIIGGKTYLSGSKKYELYVGKAVEDATFDFTGYQNYGSGVALSTSTNTYLAKDGYVFTAGNITMTTFGDNSKYFSWYDVDGKNELRFYSDTGYTLTAPEGYVITNVEFTGKQNCEKMTVSTGTLSGSNTASTWTGVAPSITFTRGAGNPGYYTITVTYTNKFTKEVGDANWATWIAPYNVEVPSGVSAYIVSSSDDSKATLGELLAIPANTPVLLKGEGSHDFVVCDDETLEANVVDPESNLLEVSDEETTSGVYVLANRDSHGVGFYLWDGGLLGAGYVYLPANVSARDFIGFDFEETTAISNLSDKTKEVRSEFFNLAGQRIAKPMKGLYITNGKKIIIK